MHAFEPRVWILRVVLSGHFCMSLHVGHARNIRLVFDYRITDVEAQIETNKRYNQLHAKTWSFRLTLASVLLPLFGRQKTLLSLSRVRDWLEKRLQKKAYGVESYKWDFWSATCQNMIFEVILSFSLASFIWEAKSVLEFEQGQGLTGKTSSEKSMWSWKLLIRLFTYFMTP